MDPISAPAERRQTRYTILRRCRDDATAISNATRLPEALRTVVSGNQPWRVWELTNHETSEEPWRRDTERSLESVRPGRRTSAGVRQAGWQAGWLAGREEMSGTVW